MRENNKDGFFIAKQILSKNYLYVKHKNYLTKKHLFIYLNLIILYFFLFILYKRNCNISNSIRYKGNKTVFNDNIDSIYENTKDSIINKHRRLSIVWPLPKEIKFRPLMTNKEIIALSYSVESDAEWHEKLKNSGIKANYITIDLNVSDFGYPGANTDVNDWKKYIQSYKKEYNADIILIDGRFRVACALDIFSKIKNDTIVLIHDYERKKYHVLEQFYLKIKSWDSLFLFLKNPKVKSVPKGIYNLYLKEKLI